MWPDNGGDNQKWYFDDDQTIRSGLGNVLSVKDGSLDCGSSLLASSNEDLESQKFRIVPVSK
jgi:hypothetical protein